MISSLIPSIAANDLAAASVALYLLPALIAWARRLPGLATIVTLDVLTGWTLIGWAIALLIALRPARQLATAPARNLTQAPRPTSRPHSAGWAGPPGPPPSRVAPPPPLILPGSPGRTVPASRADQP